MKHTIVIIGSGMASYMLAIQIRMQNKDVNIAVVTQCDGRYYPKPMLSSALYHKKSLDDIVTSTAAQMAEKYALQVYTHEYVENIDSQQKAVETRSGKKIEYAKLVLATGSNPNKLNLPQGGGEYAYQVNTLEDYARFRKEIANKKEIAVIGSGLVGVEFTHDLVHAGYKVRVFSLEDLPLAGLVPGTIADVLKKHLISLGVDWHTAPLDGIEKAQTGYVLKTSKKSHQADAVLASIGIHANLDLVKKSKVNHGQAIEVDTYLATSVKDIYALGDCASLGALHLTYVAPIKQQAKALAHTLLDKPTEVYYPAMPVVVKVPTLPFCLVPVRGKVAGAWEDQPGSGHKSFVSVFYDTNRIIRGFALAGEATSQRNHWLSQMPDLLGASNV